MTISKELIERYHNGQCSPEEMKAVEDWLFDDEFADEPALPLPIGGSTTRIQDDMWDEISTVLPSRQKPVNQFFFVPYWRQAAAVFLISLTGAVAWYFTKPAADQGIVVVNNASESDNKALHESAYSLTVGPKSNVEIDNVSGHIEFCGTMMINPKRDIVLTIEGMCARPDSASEKLVLKKGENYIALHYGNAASANEVIILPQGSLNGLPPLMQRHLMMQFNI